MMSKNYLITLLFVIFTFPLLLHAQRDNVWVFGKCVGLDFNTVTPSGIYTNIHIPTHEYYISSGVANIVFETGEAAASVCDENGALQFYTSGERIWDRSGKIMPNGDSLLRIYRRDTIQKDKVMTREFTNSCAQGALIIPFPNDPQKYYVFSLTSAELDHRDGIGGLLFYHVVDMRLNNGMGDVVTGQKRIFVDSGFTEHMTSVAGDDCNVWVVLSTLSPTKPGVEFKAFEINANGLNMNPVISNTGAPPGVFGRGSFISIAPNRKKLVATRDNILSGNAELYDFDPLTGTVSNQIMLFPNANVACYGACFSPNSEKLYISKGFPPFAVYQYDITTNNASTIIASQTTLSVKTGSTGNSISALKLGPDGKVYYISKGYYTTLNNSKTRYTLGIGAINFPNLSGMASQPDDSATGIMFRWAVGDSIDDVRMKINDTIASGFTFSNVISTARRHADTFHAITDTFICSGTGLVLQSPVDDGNVTYMWSNGSTGRTYSVTETGTFWVRSSDYCRDRIDTFKVDLVVLEQPVISVNGFELISSGIYISYQWLLNGQTIAGATEKNYNVTENGDYRVVVTGDRGCVDTSDIYKITNVSIGDVTALSHSITIYPNPVQSRIFIKAPVPVSARISGVEGKLIKTVSNAASISVEELPAGIYMIHITDREDRVLKVEKFVKMH